MAAKPWTIRIGKLTNGCVRLGNLDLDFKRRISDWQSIAKSETDLNAEISVLRFHFFRVFFFFFGGGGARGRKSDKGIDKQFLTNSRLAHARIISKKKTSVHENSFVNPFLDFPIER